MAIAPLVAASGPRLPGPAAVVHPGTPAFTTWQAPGGATAGQRVIALTFDDGPGIYTAQVLSVLQQYHVPATFFEIGEEVAANPELTRMCRRPATRSRTTPGTTRT